MLKVVVLNTLYRTGILAVSRVAEHIVRLDIDAEMQAGNPYSVHRIAQIRLGESTRNNYSFATKYCAWHNPAYYPMYDYFVDQVLWGYKKQDQFDTFLRYELWQYERFTKIILNFRNFYKLTAFTIKDLDKFLWLAGYDYFPPAWKKPNDKPSPESL